MYEECKYCKCIFENGKCWYDVTEEEYHRGCTYFNKREYFNARYINKFDIACSECGTAVRAAIKGHHIYCCKCGNKL